ncbi:cyclin-dependent kinase 1-like [Daphnia pulex]|uniref:cyclin-dependent kinase 1-like n=1 Tax=Daphnia pulex TaxID=6669 RepID=UPI001EE114F8|nr:cyclin-dependent kinase 1-like [Daphnia pulex]
MATFEIDKGNILGEGQSCVFRGTYWNKTVAIKRMVKTPSLTDDEFEFQKILKHKNVLSILAVLDDLDFRYILLELCSGSLYQVIKKTFKGTPLLPSDREVLYQIADGLDYVHSKNLVHCDIKPQNILISMTGEIKLADFGSSRKTTNGTFIPSGPIGGTLQWMAPEVCPKDSKMNKVSAMADLFSFGCVCFVFLTREKGGIHPFGDWNTPYLSAQVQCNIREGRQVNTEKLKHHPYANFIRPMIENNPDNRGTLTEFMTNLTVPTASSSIPSDMNISTFHQVEQEKTLVDLLLAQEQPNHASGSHETMLNNEETTNPKVPINCEVELTSLQSPRGFNGLSLNDKIEGDAGEADSDGSVKVDTSIKSIGEEPLQVVGNFFDQEDFEQEAKPSPSVLSGCNSSLSANGLVKRELKPKVVTNKGDYEEQEEDVRKISLNVSDEQETRDPPNLSTIKLNDTAKFETIKNCRPLP